MRFTPACARTLKLPIRLHEGKTRTIVILRTAGFVSRKISVVPPFRRPGRTTVREARTGLRCAAPSQGSGGQLSAVSMNGPTDPAAPPPAADVVPPVCVPPVPPELSGASKPADPPVVDICPPVDGVPGLDVVWVETVVVGVETVTDGGGGGTGRLGGGGGGGRLGGGGGGGSGWRRRKVGRRRRRRKRWRRRKVGRRRRRRKRWRRRKVGRRRRRRKRRRRRQRRGRRQLLRGGLDPGMAVDGCTGKPPEEERDHSHHQGAQMPHSSIQRLSTVHGYALNQYEGSAVSRGGDRAARPLLQMDDFVLSLLPWLDGPPASCSSPSTETLSPSFRLEFASAIATRTSSNSCRDLLGGWAGHRRCASSRPTKRPLCTRKR